MQLIFFSSFGPLHSGHAMLNLFVQYLYCTVLYEKSNNMISAFSRYAAVNYYTFTLLEKWEITTVLDYSSSKIIICCAQLYCIEVNVLGTNFSIK